MESTAAQVYIAAFLARCDATRRRGQTIVATPGLYGLIATGDPPLLRLLVTDDRAYDVLCTKLLDGHAGMIDVFAVAQRCAELLDGLARWRAEMVTTMICRDLQAVPAVSLPGELTIRPVRRLADDPPDGVALKDAIAAAAFGRSQGHRPAAAR